MRVLSCKYYSMISDEEFRKYIHGRNADFTMEYFLNKKFSREEIAQVEEEKEKNI